MTGSALSVPSWRVLPAGWWAVTPIDTILHDWINGGHLTIVDQHQLQHHGYLRLDRYGSPVLTTTGTNTIKEHQCPKP